MDGEGAKLEFGEKRVFGGNGADICSGRESVEKQLQPELVCGDAILPFPVRKLWLSLLISWLQGQREVCKYQIAGMKQHCKCYRNL